MWIHAVAKLHQWQVLIFPLTFLFLVRFSSRCYKLTYEGREWNRCQISHDEHPTFSPTSNTYFIPPLLLKPHDKIPWFFLSLCIKLQQQNVFCFFFRPRGGFFAPCVGNIIKASGKLYGKKFFGQRERESSDIYLLRYSARNFFSRGNTLDQSIFLPSEGRKLWHCFRRTERGTDVSFANNNHRQKTIREKKSLLQKKGKEGLAQIE